MFGAPASRIGGRTDYDFVPRELGDLFRRKDMEAIEAGGPRTTIEEVVCAGDGATLLLETIKTPMLDGNGRLIGVLGIGRDVSERFRQEERLRLAARVFESTAEGIVIADRDDRVVAVNRAFIEITGHSEGDAVGREVRDLLWADRDDADAILATLDDQGVWQGETLSRRRNGDAFHQWQTVSLVRDDTGAASHRVIVFSDITSIKRSQEALDFLAHHDSLTGLPNRTSLHDHLRQALERAGRDGGRVAVLFVDLDGFKHINDSLGHPVGDQLLRVASSKMRGLLGDATPISRLGGDEFVAVLVDADTESAAATGSGINALFREPLLVDGRELYITASIGIALFPDDGEDADVLLKHADLAMYRAKEDGRNTLRFYEPVMGDDAGRRLLIGGALRGALQRSEMTLVYQPQTLLADGRLIGVEALLRWSNLELGPIPPDQFIPIAEENGAIQEIGAWVLNQACRQMAFWRDAGFAVPRMAINLSVQQIEHGDLIPLVKSALDRYGLRPSELELEVTESMAMRQTPWVRDTLDHLNRSKLQLAIDDFGTGHSSLSRLKRLPVHRLKIDKSFIRDIGSDPNDEAIVRAIITLGHSLGLEIVAEGVETAEQAAFLRTNGCDSAQGYLYGKPVPPDELMRTWNHFGARAPDLQLSGES